jgi:hypothetical protein
MVISERVDDMSVDEILPLPGIKPPQPLDRYAIRIGQTRIGWYGPFPDRIGHAVAALLPAETAADGPEMGRRVSTMTRFARSAPGEEPVTA